jgi:predicted nucleic acid-binding Zn ribbon protein
MTKAKTPRVLGSLMSDVYRKIGMTEAYDEYKTLQIWEKVVGDTIAKVTVIEKMKDGELYVRVRNPSWRMELNFRKRDIVNRLNQAIGYEMIRAIIFK